MESVKKSIDERAQHKREYDSWVNERQMQTTKEKDTSSRSRNDAHADDADIRPIYDEEPMAKVQTTAEINVFATGQQHTEQPEFNNEGEVDQNAEQCHDTTRTIGTVQFKAGSQKLVPPADRQITSRTKSGNYYSTIHNNDESTWLGDGCLDLVLNDDLSLAPSDAIAQPSPAIRVSATETCGILLYGGSGIPFQLKSDSLPHAHAKTTKTYYKHQDSRIKKAQVLKTNTSANSDIQDLPLRYQVYQGRLLASFQDDVKYEHVSQDTRSQDGRDDQD
ncbi:hypothetical protein Tco_1165964 [Tanacetum coccineum]